jgi:hypothetical protein
MALNLSHLDGTNGFRLEGIDEGDSSGISVAGAGDVNGDGIGDLIVGAYRADPDGQYDAGESYVVFGMDTDFAASLDLAALDGSNGFRLDGIDAGDWSGASVAGAGDVNGDGIDDLIAGAYFAAADGKPAAGESYVVFGTDTGFAASLDLSALDGSNGFRLNGIDSGDRSGFAVASVGDVNGDGIDDVIVGAIFATADGKPDAGESYVVFGTNTGFAASLDLAALDGSNGFRLDGIDAGDWSGASVAGAGDVNGDGIDDLTIGASQADPDGKSSAGESYIVFGTEAGFAASLDLSALDGSNGFRLDGIDAGDGSGFSVAAAGDVNGDGFDDLIVGAPGAGPDGDAYAGESYVVFGTGAGFAARLELSALDGSNGFRLDGIDTYDNSGYSVAGAGDINGDGFDDLIVGAPGTGGESYVVFGRDAGFAASLDLSALDGSSGFRLDAGGGRSGASVAGAGDVNGDGTDDLIVGAYRAAPDGKVDAGESYVIFGSTQLGGANDAPLAAADVVDVVTLERVDLAADNGNGRDRDPDFDDLRIVGINGVTVAPGGSVTLASGLRVTLVGSTEVRFDAPSVRPGTSLSDMIAYEISDGRGGSDTAIVTVDFTQNAITLAELNGTTGFRLDGIDAYDNSGYSVAGAGDINGDGFDDVIVGAWGAGGQDVQYGAGESYVVFGRETGFVASLDLSALDGSNGFELDGIGLGDSSGFSVAGAGDVNGDGIDDLIIGAPYANPQPAAGQSYVVFGTDTGFAASLNLSALDGTNGFRLDGIDADDHSGRSVAGAGDINGDGVGDLIVGARFAGRGGETYVVFGTDAGFGASLDLSTLDGSNGFRVHGIDTYDNSGASVAGAGDVNGDGIGDLIVGAPGASPDGKPFAGASYVIFGTDAGFAASLDLSALDGSNGFRLDGIAAFYSSGSSVDGAGDVNGDGIDDLIIGGFAAESYVVFGTDTGFAASLDLSSLDGGNGFRFVGSGGPVASAGDVNGDGFDDLIIGAAGADPDGESGAGESYVVFGTDAGFAANLDLSVLDGSNGFRLDGVDTYDSSGQSVAGAGAVNGDGFDDLIGGAPGADADGDSYAGESYVVFGFSTGEPQTPIFGGPGRDVLAGSDASESFHPGGGYDFVTTGGGTDTVFFDDLAGKRDVLTIADFDPLADTLDLRGAAIAERFESETQTVLLLDSPDRDTVVLLGLSESPLDLI